MKPSDRDVQEREWVILYDRIKEALQRIGEEQRIRSNEYFLLDENWGHHQHEIETRNLALLKPGVVRFLQALLVGFPDWEISIGVDVVTRYEGWPPMGIVVSEDEIVDGLQRQYLPDEFQRMVYQGRTRKLGVVLEP